MIDRLLLFALWPFTSGGMLWWGLAAGIPWLIHLWSRRKYDEIEWAAIDHLLAAVRKNARRIRLEHLLLLAVRTTILILFAIAMADPVMTLLPRSDGKSTTTARLHTMLVIDGSYSMAFRQAERTRFEVAKASAQEIIQAGQQGDGFTLVSLADRPQAVIATPAYDVQDLTEELALLQRTDGGADLLATLALVRDTLAHAVRSEPELTRHRICFITDLGETTWNAVTDRAVRSTLETIAETATLELIDVGQKAAENVAVTSVTASDGIVTISRPTRIQVELENFGSQDVQDKEVAVLVDGERISEQRVDVAAGGTSSISTQHLFQVPGEHGIQARCSQDQLAVDDRRWLNLSVRPAIKVLCIEGQAGAASNLALALNPSRSAAARIQVVTRSENALLEEDLPTYDCVFLSDIGRFAQNEAVLLDQFVKRGGGLVVFLGDQVQPDNYNRVLVDQTSEQPLLGAALGDPASTGDYQIDPLDYQHPVVEAFRGNERAGLLTTPIWKYMRLLPDPKQQTETVAALRNGDPLILAHQLGEGRVLLAATAASSESIDRTTTPPTPWTAWAAWPSFPPLVQLMLEYAVEGGGASRTVPVGEPLRGTFPLIGSDVVLNVEDPASGRHRVSTAAVGDRSQWEFAATERSGLYHVRRADNEALVGQFAVNLDTRESRLDRQDPATLPTQFGRQLPSSEVADLPSETKRPKHYFRYILALVLGLLLVESGLAGLWGRVAV